MAHPNEDVIRRGYEAFSQGDMETLRRLFQDDIVWHVPGRNPLADDYQGVDAVLGYFAQTMELSEGSFEVKVHDVVAGDDHTVGLHTASAERAGKRLEDDQVLVFHLSEGRVASVWQFFGDPYAGDEFWS